MSGKWPPNDFNFRSSDIIYDTKKIIKLLWSQSQLLKKEKEEEGFLDIYLHSQL